MIYLIGIVLVLAIMWLPSAWVRSVMRRHNGERSDYPGTGGELATHLLAKMNIDDVKLEPTEQGDHYDPIEKAVRLTPEKLNGRSLTSVVVAAHEVGHAIQHHRKETLFNSRTAVAKLAMWTQRLTPLLFMAVPLLVAFSPALSRLCLIVAIASMLTGVLMHLITLPVEWDASFGKALPMLKEGGYLSADDMQGAKQILTAAAFTYVAASLSSLLSLGVLGRLLRR